MDKEDKNFKEKIKLGSDALFWINLANESYFHLRNQLITLATLLLPLTASIVILSKDSKVLPSSQEKNLLIIGWILLGASIVFGLIQTWVDSTFFKGLSGDSSLREHFRNNLPGALADRVIKLLPHTPSKSTHWPLFFQTLTLLGGIIFIMFVAHGMLQRL